MKSFVVYRITNLKNGMIYIGSTGHFQVRKSEHLGQLRTNKHCNRHLQEDFNIYKEKSFVFEVINDGFRSRQEMLLREYELIVKTFKTNYNIESDCPIINIHKQEKSFHQQFKVKFQAPDAAKKANKKLRKAKQRKRRIKTYHPTLDKIALLKADRVSKNIINIQNG